MYTSKQLFHYFKRGVPIYIISWGINLYKHDYLMDNPKFREQLYKAIVEHPSGFSINNIDRAKTTAIGRLFYPKQRKQYK